MFSFSIFTNSIFCSLLLLLITLGTALDLFQKYKHDKRKQLADHSGQNDVHSTSYGSIGGNDKEKSTTVDEEQNPLLFKESESTTSTKELVHETKSNSSECCVKIKHGTYS